MEGPVSKVSNINKLSSHWFLWVTPPKKDIFSSNFLQEIKITKKCTYLSFMFVVWENCAVGNEDTFMAKSTNQMKVFFFFLIDGMHSNTKQHWQE